MREGKKWSGVKEMERSDWEALGAKGSIKHDPEGGEKLTELKTLTTSERQIKNVGEVSYVCRKSKQILQ